MLPLAILLATPAFPQFESIQLKFEGMGCASCVESMPARLARMRGVEKASVDAASSLLTIRLAASNRVRLEQVRDAVQQDGTKVRSASVVLRGAVYNRGGVWMIEPVEAGAAYRLAGTLEWTEGKRYRVSGAISEPAPGAVLQVRSAEAISSR
jgi:cation transport ATPase